MKPKTLLTPKDLETELPDLGRSTIYSLLKAGMIPSIRLGKKYFTPRAALDQWLANCCQPELKSGGIAFIDDNGKFVQL
jgi:excisionase family DNA binding protein